MKLSGWITLEAYLDGRKALQDGISVGHAPSGDKHRKSWLRGYYDDSETFVKVVELLQKRVTSPKPSHQG